MGGQLVKGAFAASFRASQRCEPLSANEMRILAFMAVTAYDVDDEHPGPPRYFGGRDALATHALGRVVPAESDDPSAVRRRASIFKSVKVALQMLARRQLIGLDGAAFPGRNQEYVLLVENWPWGGLALERQIPPIGTSDSPIENPTFPHLESDVPNGGTPDTPQDQEPNDQLKDQQLDPIVVPARVWCRNW